MIHTTRRKSARLLIAAALILPASGALADRIDGDWCNPEGRHLSIKGNEIVTPGGVKMEGSYSRHAFSYVAPPAEPEAGSTVNLQLMGETRVFVQVAGAAGQTWKRCENVS